VEPPRHTGSSGRRHRLRGSTEMIGKGQAYGIVPAALVCLLGLSLPAMGAPDIGRMQDSAVRVRCQKKPHLPFTGSGFVVGDKTGTYVVTTLHTAVCSEAEDKQPPTVILGPGDEVAAPVVWSDANMDVAVLRPARPLGRPFATLSESRTVPVGEPVIAVSFPVAADDTFIRGEIAVPSVSRGIVSRVGTCARTQVPCFVHTASSNPGASGGPVYDEHGVVIGMNSDKPLVTIHTVTPEGDSIDRVAAGESITAATSVAALVLPLETAGISVSTSGEGGWLGVVLTIVALAVSLVLGGKVAITTPWGRVLLSRLQKADGDASKSEAQPKRRSDRPRTYSIFRSKPRPVYSPARIRIVEGPLAGETFPLTKWVVLGRDPNQAAVVFPPDETKISRRHCQIRFDFTAQLFEVRDLSSQNGTYAVKGASARRMASNSTERFAPGQRILIGSPRNQLVLELK